MITSANIDTSVNMDTSVHTDVPANMVMSAKMSTLVKMSPMLRSYISSFRSNLIGTVAEALVSEVALGSSQSHDFFIKAFEGGRMDLGLYLGSEPVTGTATDRLYWLLKHKSRTLCIYPGDVKHFSATTDDHGGLYWRLCLTESQAKDCQFLVVISAADSHTVALIPTAGYQDRLTPTVKTIYTSTIRWFHLSQALPAFPPQWAPVLLPLSQLGEALANMRAFVLGESAQWFVILHPV